MSISLDKVGLRIRAASPIIAPVENPLTGELFPLRLNPEVSVWSLRQARKLVSALQEAIDVLATPDQRPPPC